MTQSIRASLVTGTVVATIGIIAVAGSAVYRGVRSALVRQFDQGLSDEARMLASAIRVSSRGVELGFDELDMERFTRKGGTDYLQVWAGGQTVLYRSASLRGKDMKPLTGEAGHPVLTWESLDGDSHVRSAALTLRPPVDEDDEDEDPEVRFDVPASDINLVLARSVADMDALLARLRVILVSVGLLTSAAAGGVLSAVIRRSMRPLDQLAGEISRLSGGELSSRIDMPSTPREVTPVVEQLNGLLARLEAAFQRERTFSADIAHELRTPLAGIRSTIEVAVSRSRPAGDYQATLGELLEIVRRLQAMVERLLYLGRLESAQIEIEEGMVDLGELVRTSWKPLEEQAVQRGLDVQWNLHPGLCAVTDPLLLEVAIRNLLENAVAYANEGGYIIIALHDEGARSVLRVTNDGSKVAQDDVTDLMDRFSRADRSRGATGNHCGLGLAMVSRIATVLRCTLAVHSIIGGEFEVVLSIRNHRAGTGQVDS